MVFGRQTADEVVEAFDYLVIAAVRQGVGEVVGHRADDRFLDFPSMVAHHSVECHAINPGLDGAVATESSSALPKGTDNILIEVSHVVHDEASFAIAMGKEIADLVD